MKGMEVFHCVDPLTGDGLTVEVADGRVFVTALVDGQARTVILTEPGSRVRLAEALLYDVQRRRT